MQSEANRIDVKILTEFVSDVLHARGVPENDAKTVADCLVFANRSGIDSHGVVRLAHYVRRLELGSIKSQPKLKFYPRAGAIGYVNGDDGLGHVVSQYATDHTIRLATSNGVSAVSVGNSSHFGMAGYYALQMAAQGFVGICMTATDKLLVPYGAVRPFFGSNPICFAFPTDGMPVVLDMATTSVAYGNIALAAIEGESIPDDWAIDSEGKATTDPNAAVGLHPAAGPKGSGLSMVIDILCSVLASMPWGPHINEMYGDLAQPRKLGHLFLALDVSRFMPIQAFESSLGELLTEVNALEPAPGFDSVLYPGQLAGQRRKLNDRIGLRIESSLLEELDAVALAANVEPIRDREY